MIGECTLGDWETEISANERFYITTSGKPNCSHTVIARLMEGSQDERRANAYLMSAGKDLYSELVEADDTICDLCKRLNPTHEDCTSCQDREARLKAIRKAAGTDKFASV